MSADQDRPTSDDVARRAAKQSHEKKFIKRLTSTSECREAQRMVTARRTPLRKPQPGNSDCGTEKAPKRFGERRRPRAQQTAANSKLMWGPGAGVEAARGLCPRLKRQGLQANLSLSSGKQDVSHYGQVYEVLSVSAVAARRNRLGESQPQVARSLYESGSTVTRSVSDGKKAWGRRTAPRGFSARPEGPRGYGKPQPVVALPRC